MSFTPDELQAFNTILEQKLAQHRRELERVFEQRLHIMKRDLVQRLTAGQQEIMRTISQGLGEQNRKLRGMLGQIVLVADEDVAETKHEDDIETEVDWEDLSAIISQSLDKRLNVLGDLRDVLMSIEQLERIVESMQVAMTTNNSLLSNRLYHHQQLPLERAHPGQAPAMLQETLPLKKMSPGDEHKDVET